ncbi:MAG: hypothetical protein PHQ96_01485 [Candidatus Omnitrophica bacterium]|nr:hypothetical protein [Candidatus Omnitrophota bacterium]
MKKIIFFLLLSLLYFSQVFGVSQGKNSADKKEDSFIEKDARSSKKVLPAPSASSNASSALAGDMKTETPNGPQAAYVPDENDVKSFVYRWFAWLDHRVEDFLFLYHVSKDDLIMDLPEAKIRSHDDFRKWYQQAQSNIVDSHYEVGDIKVKVLPKNRYSAEFFVSYKSKTSKGKMPDIKYKESWELSVSGAGRLTINRCIVKKIK